MSNIKAQRIEWCFECNECEHHEDIMETNAGYCYLLGEHLPNVNNSPPDNCPLPDWKENQNG